MNIFPRCFLIALFYLAGWCPIALHASSEVSYPRYGINFTPPAGWEGEETAYGYVLGSHTHPGLIIIDLHEIDSMQQLKMLAAQELTDGSSYALAPVGVAQAIDEQTLAGEFQGWFGGEQARAYAAAMVNPHGPGLLILGVTSAAAYGPAQRQAVLELVESVTFSARERGEIDQQWTQRLADHRLIHMSSSGGSRSGSSGFASSRTEADLCRGGRFSFSSSSQVAATVPGVSGHSHGGDSGSGQWRVETGSGDAGVLILEFDDGRMQEYRLTPRSEAGEINVDGERWFLSRSRSACG